MLTRVLMTVMVSLLCMACAALAQAKIPNLHIELSYRQFEDGKLSEGIHLFDLWCDNERCDLTVLSVNQCLAGSFFPQVELWSTGDLAAQGPGTLQVQYRRGGVLHLQVRIAGGTLSYLLRFREAKTEDEENQSQNRLFPPSEAPKRLILTDFKGNLTKYSGILDKLIAVEFVPVTEIYTVVTLNCEMRMSGTASLKKGK
jgi:hypothetical protein